MRLLFLSVFISFVDLIYSQSPLDEYKNFTPERRQILSKMGDFFDETVRKNFPAETDTISYLFFHECYLQTGGTQRFVLNVDRDKLKEINQMLFQDHNYYFFYAHYYIYVGKMPPPGYIEPKGVDSVPTVRHIGGNNNGKFGYHPVLNMDGYINVVPDENPAIKRTKEDMKVAGGLSLTIFMSNVMGINVREISQPSVKELCAVAFWRYVCNWGGIDLVGRKPFCEPCDL